MSWEQNAQWNKDYVCTFVWSQVVFRNRNWATARMCSDFPTFWGVMESVRGEDFWRGAARFVYLSFQIPYLHFKTRFSVQIPTSIGLQRLHWRLAHELCWWKGVNEWKQGKKWSSREQARKIQSPSTGTQVIKVKTITHIHRAGQHIF